MMTFKAFSIFGSGNNFVRRSRTVCAISLEGSMRNILNLGRWLKRLSNYGRWHNRKHSCENIFKFKSMVQDEMSF